MLKHYGMTNEEVTASLLAIGQNMQTHAAQVNAEAAAADAAGRPRPGIMGTSVLANSVTGWAANQAEKLAMGILRPNGDGTVTNTQTGDVVDSRTGAVLRKGLPSWAIPAAVVGGGAALLLVLMKLKKRAP